jgi:hypothetical protein
MIRPLYLSYISLIFALLILSVMFAQTGFIWGIVINIIVGFLWGLAIWRSWRIGGLLGLFFVILGISVAVIAAGVRWLSLVSTLSVLATWDLSSFHRKLSDNEEIREEDELIRIHLLRLSGVMLLGLTLPAIAFVLTIELKFWQVFLLGALLVLGLSQVFSQLKRSSN